MSVSNIDILIGVSCDGCYWQTICDAETVATNKHQSNHMINCNTTERAVGMAVDNNNSETTRRREAEVIVG